MPRSEESKRIILETEREAERIFQAFIAENGVAITAQLRDLGKDEKYITDFWEGYKEDVRKLALEEYHKCLSQVVLAPNASSSKASI